MVFSRQSKPHAFALIVCIYIDVRTKTRYTLIWRGEICGVSRLLIWQERQALRMTAYEILMVTLSAFSVIIALILAISRKDR